MIAAMAATAPANASLEATLANICDIVKSDDKGELRKKMRQADSEFSLKLRDYYSGIKCNGKSLIKFSIQHEAVEAGTLLVKKMPKKLLAEPEHDGKSLQAWIDEQGLASNPVAIVLLDRI